MEIIVLIIRKANILNNLIIENDDEYLNSFFNNINNLKPNGTNIHTNTANEQNQLER